MNCKHCQSDKTVKAGWDYRASGRVQRWICKECGKMTIQNDVQIRLYTLEESIE